jgi:hypothetical protein
MFQTVIQVKPTQDFKVYVYFSDGRIKLYDVTPHIGKGVYKQISDITIFVSKCTVINHTLAWDLGGNFDPYKCLDIAPETIYSDGIDVADPLEQKAA